MISHMGRQDSMVFSWRLHTTSSFPLMPLVIAGPTSRLRNNLVVFGREVSGGQDPCEGWAGDNLVLVMEEGK